MTAIILRYIFLFARLTPFEVMFGCKAFHPVDLEMGRSCVEAIKEYQDAGIDTAYEALSVHRKECLVSAKENILLAQVRQKQQYDRKHVHAPNFQIGTCVLKKDFTRKRRKGGKLDLRWNGPYFVDAYIGKGIYHLQSVADPHDVVARINGAHLKHYIQIPKV